MKLKYLILLVGAFLLYCSVFYVLWYNLHDSSALSSSKNKTSSRDRHVSDIDWHDYDFIAAEASREGFGEGGRGEILPENEKEEGQRRMKRYGFNGLVSDRVSLNRSITDTRPSQ